MWVLPARQDEVLLMYLRLGRTLGRTAEKGEEKQQRKAGEGEEKRNEERNRRALCTHRGGWRKTPQQAPLDVLCRSLRCLLFHSNFVAP